MYTQCPDCSTAFRVTADVLKQAAGKVRCGGCGNAFNALDYLSESMPQQPAPREADKTLPELTPELSRKTDGLPESISAEQSAALLKTLDELAGSDIRIEDTGVEWRVLDDDDVGDATGSPVANEADAEILPANDLGTDVDELLEESPTPVDQFLTETPPQVDSPEIFEEPPLEFSRTSVDELRFDDNTPLPDDFGLDDQSLFSPVPVDEPEDHVDEPADNVETDRQADLDLSEPDEWTDILGEFENLAEAVAAPLDAELDTLEGLDELKAEEPEPELEPEVEVEVEAEVASDDIDAPLDMDSQFALQAEAMGIDLSGIHESPQEPEVEDDLDLETLLENRDAEDRDIEDLLDEDLVEEFEEEELNLDLDDAEQLDLIDDDDDDDDDEIVDEPDEEYDELEGELDEDLEDDFEEELEEDREDDLEEDLEEDLEGDLEDDLEDDLEEELEPEQEEPREAAVEDDSGEHFVPPLTEEEQTINMQIDQDLLALAIEDEDGFASTIVIAEEAAETEALKKKKKKEKKTGLDLKDTNAGFETIIMEGESIRNEVDNEKLAADVAAAASLLSAAAAEHEADSTARAGGRRFGMIAGTLALVLLLTVQVLHQSREALATIPAFNNIAAPLYRAIGMPLSPEWDITGWRFEVTRHSVGEADESEAFDGSEDVMIFSRVGNNSDKPLPYPVIGIFLTDRYEEPIGGFTLDPVDYLPDDLDPRKLVEPGNTFNAVMTIRSPSAEAVSFRLRACYRNADGSLRCKDDSFK